MGTLPTQGRIERAVNVFLFIAHNVNTSTLRRLYGWRGEGMRLFGGTAYGTFAASRALMAEEQEKIDWFSGPIQGRTDYLTRSYMPFLLEGPNHALRRRQIIGRVAQTQARLDDLDALLAKEKDHERALVKFLYRHFARLELTDEEIEAHLDFRERARVLTLMPTWVRRTAARSTHERLRAFRSKMLRRMEEIGEPIGDSWFDVIWFNSGTLGFYPEEAIKTLKARPDLQAPIKAEVDLPAGQRPRTRSLIHEMLRIHTKIASTNYMKDGKVSIALIATATVDPARYERPYEVDLDRNHDDAVAFSGSAPNRGCPGEKFAPDAMACVVAHFVRSGALDAK